MHSQQLEEGEPETLRMYFSDNFCVGRQDKRFFYLKCHGIISHDERERMSRKHSRIFLEESFILYKTRLKIDEK